MQHAAALHMRLLDGSSVLDRDGNEVPVSDPRRRKPPNGEKVPTVAMLQARYAHCDLDGTDRDTQSEPGQEQRAPSALYARVKRLEQERVERDAKSGEKRRGEMESLTASMMATLHSRADRRLSLPCYELDPLAHPQRGGDDSAATEACEAVKAYRDCSWRRDAVTCPRARLAEAYAAASQYFTQAGVPLALASRLRAATVGHRTADGRLATVARLESRPALQIAAAWLTRRPTDIPGYSLPLRGDESFLMLASAKGGEGKSMAAAWCLAQHAGRWISASELVQIRAESYSRAEWVEAGLLVVDDAGTETLTEWGRGRIYDVIAQRIADGRLTLVTSNVSRAAFIERYDPRFERRIAESGYFARLAPWQP